MRGSIMSKLLVSWASGKFSLWKISFVIGILFILSPWMSLLGSKFAIESQLTNPNRTVSVYVNNGLFTFITTLEDGTVRKSSGVVGYINKKLYFLTLSSQYLYIADYDSKAFKRDRINMNNRYFNVALSRSKNKFYLRYEEDIAPKRTHERLLKLYGELSWLEW